MSKRARRIGICLLAFGAVVVFAGTTLGWALQSLSCEGQAFAVEQTVRCDAVRGHSWIVFQEVLCALAGAVLIAGIAWALRRARVWPLAAAALPVIILFVAVYAIGGIALAAKPLPRLSGVRLLDRRCADLCSGGLRLVFTIDRAAPVWFVLAPDAPYTARPSYLARIVAPPGASPPGSSLAVGAGSHLVRFELTRCCVAARRAPLRPGRYNLDITALVADAGNQAESTTDLTLKFTVGAGR